jgi:TolB protein
MLLSMIRFFKKNTQVLAVYPGRVILPVLLVLFFAISLNTPLQAFKIKITEGSVRPDPIAIVPLHSPDGDLQEVGANISKVIGADLESCGLFKLISSQAFIQTPESLIRQGPSMHDWRLIKSRFLVYGTVRSEGGKVQTEFRLYDVFNGQMILGLSLSGEEDKWRKIAHMIADAIYRRVTNMDGYFNSQIIYVEPLVKKRKKVLTRLRKMDFDGHNNQSITDGSEHIVSPMYSPDNQWVLFGAYDKDGLKTYLMNLNSGDRRLLGNFETMNFAARFSPDSRDVVLTLVKKGKSAIYRLNLASRKLTQLTQHTDIDTSPSYSADGKEIVFTSNRDGKENIYVMDSTGNNIRRISFGGGKYSQPMWSPKGDHIVFTKQEGSSFYIGIMSPDGSNERFIADNSDGYLVERPIWSPDGSGVIFTKEVEPGKNYIYWVHLSGRFVHRISTPKYGFDPTWSPLSK